jgi:capsule polysaccharide modification protein KpsS
VAILVCHHTQNFDQTSLLEALVRRDPHKHSCHASFDFEGLQVAGARSGGQIKHLPKQIYAPDDFAVILVCQHTQNYAHNSFLEALVHHDPHKYSYHASFDFEGLQVEAKQPFEEEGTLLLPHLNG